MKVFDYDASNLIGAQPYRAVLERPIEALADMMPPTPQNAGDVITARKRFCDEKIDRGMLFENLLASHKRRRAPASVYPAIELVREKNTFFVITGQQPVLLGGPLMIYYKILHTILLAKQLNEEYDYHFLPVFWNASEDHDFDEIASVEWIGKDKTIASYTWPNQESSPLAYFQRKASSLPWDELVRTIQETTHATEFQEDILQQLKEGIDKAYSYPDAFDQWIWMLFEDSGLIIIRPDDDWMRSAAKDIMRAEIQEPLATTQSIETAGQRLKEQGLAPQIHKRADRTAFFWIDEKGRQAVRWEEEQFEIEDGRTFSADEVTRFVDRQPQAFSSSAILRPIVQDALLPTVACVLGPGELAYHFLLGDVYQRHGVPRPWVVPRHSATLVEKRDGKMLDRYNLSPHDLKQDTAALVKEQKRDSASMELKEMKEKIDHCLNAFFDELIEQAKGVDPTMEKPLRKNFHQAQKQIEQSEGLLIRRISDKDKTMHQQIESVQTSLLPHGELQERVFPIIFYLMKYGPALLTDLEALLTSRRDSSHCFIEIP